MQNQNVENNQPKTKSTTPRKAAQANSRSSKSKKTKVAKGSSLRLEQSACEELTRIKKLVNNKDFGRVINISEIIHFALSKVDQADIKRLQASSIKGVDYTKRFRKIYVEKYGSIDSDEWERFRNSDAWIPFYQEYKDVVVNG